VAFNFKSKYSVVLDFLTKATRLRPTIGQIDFTTCFDDPPFLTQIKKRYFNLARSQNPIGLLSQPFSFIDAWSGM
jgi:hypothetical protein